MAKMPTKKLVKPELKIEKVVKKGKEIISSSETVEELPGSVYTEPTCNVGISAGFTMNKGNYNSIKMSVSVFIPCYVNEIDDTFDAIKSIVDEKLSLLSSEVDDLTEA